MTRTLAAALLALCLLGAAAQAQKPARRASSPRPDAATATADPAPAEADSFDAARLANLVFSQSNAERRRAGLQPLARSEALDAVAQGHSADMAKRNYFSHTSPGLLKRETLADRLKADGVTYRRAAENIALYPLVLSRTFQRGPGVSREVSRQGTTYGELAASVVDGWMKSRGHRKNLLDPNQEHMGIGVALGMRDGLPYAYVTQNMSADR